MLENKSTCTQPQPTPRRMTTKTTSSQKISPTYKSEAHQQLLIQTAQEAHTVPGASNLGHPPDQNNSQMHLIAMLCLLKLWRQCKPLHEPLWEEEEAKTPSRTLAVKVKTLSGLGTPLTSLLDEPPGPLEGLEALEDQENLRYPPIISSPSNQQER
jgi:hypothetical protein